MDIKYTIRNTSKSTDDIRWFKDDIMPKNQGSCYGYTTAKTIVSSAITFMTTGGSSCLVEEVGNYADGTAVSVNLRCRHIDAGQDAASSRDFLNVTIAGMKLAYLNLYGEEL